MVIIKNMEMPKSCEVCDFRKSDPYSGEVYCSKAIGSNTIIYKKERLENCPLVEIITCKDCKHNGTMYCKCFMCDGNEYMSYHNPNFYCANGERRE